MDEESINKDWDRPRPDFALILTMVGGQGSHYWYPRAGGEISPGDAIKLLKTHIRSNTAIATGDPKYWSGLSSIIWVNAGHVVSFQIAGGHR